MGKLGWFRGISLVLTLMMVALIAFALPAGSQQPEERGTITLFDPNKTNYEKIVDEGRNGFSPGDMILFVDAQFDPETCERRGTLIGRITISKFLRGENAWFVGDFTLNLPDGKLTAAAGAKFSEFAQTVDGVFAITGGTGAYRDASGEVRFQEDVTMCERNGTLTTIDIGPQP
jgi:hypothetical protein